jgi:hypothetical protein
MNALVSGVSVGVSGTHRCPPSDFRGGIGSGFWRFALSFLKPDTLHLVAALQSGAVQAGHQKPV